MNTTAHLIATLWGAMTLQGLALAAGLLFVGRGRAGTGVPVLGALGVAGLAASHWLPWVPGLAPEWPSLAFLGALLLPAVVLLQLEQEAGQPASPWRTGAVLVGAFLPAVLLPAQIVGNSVCLLPDQCGPAAPFIVLMHLGTASLLILLALPALGQLTRQRRAMGQRRPSLSTGGLLITIALVHLGGLLGGLGMPLTNTLAWEFSLAAMQLVLMQLLCLVSLGHLLRPNLVHAPATPLTTAYPPTASLPPTCVLQAQQPLGTLHLPPLEPCAEPDLPDSADTLHSTSSSPEPTEETAALPRPSVSDQGVLNHIAQRAVLLLREQALYRQPQLRRKDLADKLDVPDYLLSRALNASQGQSFIELVNGMRLNEAKQRLLNGHEAITTIAYDVGFNSLASFNRAFRDDTGASPSEFRHGQHGKDANRLLLAPHAQTV